MAGKDYKLTLVMIGPKNVGKTVFLSALANSPGIGIGDPASVRAIKLHWEALSKGELPSAPQPHSQACSSATAAKSAKIPIMWICAYRIMTGILRKS